jgi:hypothetical protein
VLFIPDFRQLNALCTFHRQCLFAGLITPETAKTGAPAAFFQFFVHAPFIS